MGMIQGSKTMQTVNTALRVSFAIVFLIIRGLYGSLYLLPLIVYGIVNCQMFDTASLAIIVPACLFLIFLQLKWSQLIVLQVVKMFSGKSKKKDDSPEVSSQQPALRILCWARQFNGSGC